MIDFKKIEAVKLSKGSHDNPNDGLCFMEMVAWFEGEKHSDRPQCACPVLGKYGIVLNDTMPHNIRNELLLPLVPKMAGTRCPNVELKRAEFIAIQTVNRILPIALKGFVDSSIIQKCIEATTLKDCADGAACAAYAAHDAVRAAANDRAAAGASWAAGAAANAVEAVEAARADAACAACADAASVAAYATHAVAVLDDIGDYSKSIWQIAVNILEEAIILGRHDGFSQMVELPKRTDALLEIYKKVSA